MAGVPTVDGRQLHVREIHQVAVPRAVSHYFKLDSVVIDSPVHALLLLLCAGSAAVSPDNVNLCQAVQKVLAAARRTRGLEAQLRLLARQQRDTLLQLEAAREAEARAGRHWQVSSRAQFREQRCLDVLTDGALV